MTVIGMEVAHVMRAKRRTYAGGSAVLGVALVSTLAMHFAMQCHLSTSAVTAQVSKALQMDVQADDVSLSWSGAIVLQNLHVDDGGDEILEARRASVRLSMWDLLWGRVNVRSLTLDAPTLTLKEETLQALSGRSGPATAGSFPISIHHGQAALIGSHAKPYRVSDIEGVLALSKADAAFDGSFSDAAGVRYVVAGHAVRNGSSLQGDLRVQSDGWNGAAHLQAYQMGDRLQATITSQNGDLPGLGSYRDIYLPLAFSARSHEWKLQGGIIQTAAGTLKVSASSQGGTVSLSLRSDSFDVFSAPCLAGSGIQGSPCVLAAAAAGPWPALRLTADLRFPQLSVGQRRLSQVVLHAAGRTGYDTLKLDAMRLVVGGRGLTLSGRADWKHGFKVHFEGLDAGTVAAWCGLKQPVRLIAAGYVERQAQGWIGYLSAPAGALGDEPFDSFSGDFAKSGGGSLSVSARLVRGHQTSTLHGTFQDHRFSLEAHQLPLPLPGLLPEALSRVHGVADASAVFTDGRTIPTDAEFTVRQLRIDGMPLPPVVGSVHTEGGEAAFQVRLQELTPGMSASGKLDPATGRMECKASFAGQRLSPLRSLLPHDLGKVDGALYGDVQARGVWPTLQVSCNAEIREGRVDDLAFDRIVLAVSGTTPDRVAVHVSAQGLALYGLQGIGAVTIDSGPDLKTVSVALDFSDLKLHDRSLGPLRGHLSYHAAVLTVDHLTVPLANPPLDITGQVDAQNLHLESAVHDADLSVVASLAGPQIPAMQGKVSGTLVATGTIRSPRLQFAGHAADLAVADNRLGDADLGATVTLQETRLAASHVQAARVAPLQAALPGLDGVLDLAAVSRPHAVPHVDFRLDQGTLQGHSLPPVTGRLKWQSPVAEFTDIAMGGWHARGTVETATRECHFSGTAAAAQVPGTKLDSGRVDFKMSSRNGSSVLDVVLSQARRFGRPLPPMQAHCVLQGSRVALQPLSSPTIGLTLNGGLDLASNAITLQGTLGGQTISDLMLLAGSAPPEVAGNMSGPVTISGPTDNPTMHFDGTVTHLSYRSMQLGRGHLQLTASHSSLDGHLTLDRPVAVTSPVLGNVNIPQMASLASGLAGVSITGAILQGSPQQPVVIPTFTGVPTNLRPSPIKLPGNVQIQPLDVLQQFLRH